MGFTIPLISFYLITLLQRFFPFLKTTFLSSLYIFIDLYSDIKPLRHYQTCDIVTLASSNQKESNVNKERKKRSLM